MLGRSEWKLHLRGRITYRHCRQPKLPSFLYSSNRLFGGGTADACNATPTFCFSVPVISKLTTLTVESLWTAPTETAKHNFMAIDEANKQQPCWANCAFFLPHRPLTSRHRCDMLVRCSHFSTADCHLVRLSSTTSLWICLFLSFSV